MGNFSSINPWIPESKDFWFSQIHTDGYNKYPNSQTQGTELFRTKDIRYQFSTICADTKIWMRFDTSPFLKSFLEIHTNDKPNLTPSNDLPISSWIFREGESRHSFTASTTGVNKSLHNWPIPTQEKFQGQYFYQRGTQSSWTLPKVPGYTTAAAAKLFIPQAGPHSWPGWCSNPTSGFNIGNKNIQFETHVYDSPTGSNITHSIYKGSNFCTEVSFSFSDAFYYAKNNTCFFSGSGKDNLGNEITYKIAWADLIHSCSINTGDWYTSPSSPITTPGFVGAGNYGNIWHEYSVSGAANLYSPGFQQNAETWQYPLIWSFQHVGPESDGLEIASPSEYKIKNPLISNQTTSYQSNKNYPGTSSMFFQKNGVIMSMMDTVYESAALAINPSRNSKPTDMSTWTKYGTGPYLQSLSKIGNIMFCPYDWIGSWRVGNSLDYDRLSTKLPVWNFANERRFAYTPTAQTHFSPSQNNTGSFFNILGSNLEELNTHLKYGDEIPLLRDAHIMGGQLFNTRSLEMHIYTHHHSHNTMLYTSLDENHNPPGSYSNKYDEQGPIAWNNFEQYTSSDNILNTGKSPDENHLLKIESGGYFKKCSYSESPIFSFSHTSSNTRSLVEIANGTMSHSADLTGVHNGQCFGIIDANGLKVTYWSFNGGGTASLNGQVATSSYAPGGASVGLSNNYIFLNETIPSKAIENLKLVVEGKVPGLIGQTGHKGTIMIITGSMLSDLGIYGPTLHSGQFMFGYAQTYPTLDPDLLQCGRGGEGSLSQRHLNVPGNGQWNDQHRNWKRIFTGTGPTSSAIHTIWPSGSYQTGFEHDGFGVIGPESLTSMSWNDSLPIYDRFSHNGQIMPTASGGWPPPECARPFVTASITGLVFSNIYFSWHKSPSSSAVYDPEDWILYCPSSTLHCGQLQWPQIKIGEDEVIFSKTSSWIGDFIQGVYSTSYQWTGWYDPIPLPGASAATAGTFALWPAGVYSGSVKIPTLVFFNDGLGNDGYGNTGHGYTQISASWDPFGLSGSLGWWQGKYDGSIPQPYSEATGSILDNEGYGIGLWNGNLTEGTASAVLVVYTSSWMEAWSRAIDVNPSIPWKCKYEGPVFGGEYEPTWSFTSSMCDTFFLDNAYKYKMRMISNFIPKEHPNSIMTASIDGGIRGISPVHWENYGITSSIYSLPTKSWIDPTDFGAPPATPGLWVTGSQWNQILEAYQSSSSGTYTMLNENHWGHWGWNRNKMHLGDMGKSFWDLDCSLNIETFYIQGSPFNFPIQAWSAIYPEEYNPLALLHESGQQASYFGHYVNLHRDTGDWPAGSVNYMQCDYIDSFQDNLTRSAAFGVSVHPKWGYIYHRDWHHYSQSFHRQKSGSEYPTGSETLNTIGGIGSFSESWDYIQWNSWMIDADVKKPIAYNSYHTHVGGFNEIVRKTTWKGGSFDQHGNSGSGVGTPKQWDALTNMGTYLISGDTNWGGNIYKSGNFIGTHTTYSNIMSPFMHPLYPGITIIPGNTTASQTPYMIGPVTTSFEIQGPLHRTLAWTTASTEHNPNTNWESLVTYRKMFGPLGGPLGLQSCDSPSLDYNMGCTNYEHYIYHGEDQHTWCTDTTELQYGWINTWKNLKRVNAYQPIPVVTKRPNCFCNEINWWHVTEPNARTLLIDINNPLIRDNGYNIQGGMFQGSEVGGGNSGIQCHTSSQLHEQYPSLHIPFSVIGSTLDGRVDYWAQSFDSNGPRIPMRYCSNWLFGTGTDFNYGYSSLFSAYDCSETYEICDITHPSSSAFIWGSAPTNILDRDALNEYFPYWYRFNFAYLGYDLPIALWYNWGFKDPWGTLSTPPSQSYHFSESYYDGGVYNKHSGVDNKFFKLTFSDGYVFKGGYSLHLFTYNPKYRNNAANVTAALTQSGYQTTPVYKEFYWVIMDPKWRHSMVSRTLWELYMEQDKFIDNEEYAFITCEDVGTPGRGNTHAAGRIYLKKIEQIEMQYPMELNPNKLLNSSLNQDYEWWTKTSQSLQCDEWGWTELFSGSWPNGITTKELNDLYGGEGSGWLSGSFSSSDHTSTCLTSFQNTNGITPLQCSMSMMITPFIPTYPNGTLKLYTSSCNDIFEEQFIANYTSGPNTWANAANPVIGFLSGSFTGSFTGSAPKCMGPIFGGNNQACGEIYVPAQMKTQWVNINTTFPNHSSSLWDTPSGSKVCVLPSASFDINVNEPGAPGTQTRGMTIYPNEVIYYTASNGEIFNFFATQSYSTGSPIQVDFSGYNTPSGEWVYPFIWNTPPLSASLTTLDTTSPVAANAEVTLSVHSGVPPYNFTWNCASPICAANNLVGTTQTLQTFGGLSMGPYTVTASDSIGQEVILFIFIMVNAPPVVRFSEASSSIPTGPSLENLANAINMWTVDEATGSTVLDNITITGSWCSKWMYGCADKTDNNFTLNRAVSYSAAYSSSQIANNIWTSPPPAWHDLLDDHNTPGPQPDTYIHSSTNGIPQNFVSSSWFQSDYIQSLYAARNIYTGVDMSIQPVYGNPLTGKHLYSDEDRRLFNGIVMLENGLYAGFETGNDGIPRFMTNADWDTPNIASGTRGIRWAYDRNQVAIAATFQNP